MKICCMILDRSSFDERNLEFIKDYGSHGNVMIIRKKRNTTNRSMRR